MTATFVNLSKTATASFSDLNKNLVSLTPQAKNGSGWMYDAPGITYDALFDSLSSNVLYYDSVGSASTISNLAKS